MDLVGSSDDEVVIESESDCIKQDIFNSVSSLLTPEVKAVFDPCREPPPIPSEEGPRGELVELEELVEGAIVYLAPNTVHLWKRELASSLVQVAVVREVWEEVVKVQMMYRPEDTLLNPATIQRLPFTLLFHSSRLETVRRSAVVGRGAELRYFEEEEEGRAWSRRGEHRWFFTSTVDWEDGGLGLPSGLVREEFDEEVEVVGRELSCFGLFCGGGGLSQGLEEGGLVTTRWAVDSDPDAAATMVENRPECCVWQEDAKEVLKAAREGGELRGRQVPRRGEVELLCAGPPCQGFSGLNRFKDGAEAQRKNSLLAVTMSFMELFRPGYFVLENVAGLATLEGGTYLRRVLEALHRLGYRTTHAKLQAARFGVPQSRRRLVVVAALPHLPLPPLTTGLHLHDLPAPNPGPSALYRAVTVGDAFSDLPPITCNSGDVVHQYLTEPETAYQHELRQGAGGGVRDHVTLATNPAYAIRILATPTDPSSSMCGSKRRAVLEEVGGRRGKGGFRRLSEGGHSPAVLTRPRPAGRQGRVLHPSQHRTYSVREAARLMGFPDSYRSVRRNRERTLEFFIWTTFDLISMHSFQAVRQYRGEVQAAGERGAAAPGQGHRLEARGGLHPGYQALLALYKHKYIYPSEAVFAAVCLVTRLP